MRSLLLLVFLAMCTGCAHSAPPGSKSVAIEAPKSLTQQTVKNVTNALDKAPTFLELKRKGNRPSVMLEDESKGFVVATLYSESEDRKFKHRWATLKVELASGKVFKLGTDKNFEDQWLLEYDSKK